VNTFIYFFSGTAILLYFDWFCQHIKWIFPFCIVYMIIIFFFDYSFLYYIEPLIFSAIIVGIAYYCKPLNFLQRYDNISYGLYLYHFPVIQVLVQYKLHQHNIYITFIFALIITILLAIISWYIIEKPMLQRKVN
jgi:peptidoglycan/LPS O-acetylase OafA/YrhL